MCEVEGVGDGFCDYHWSVICVSSLSQPESCGWSYGFSGFEVVDVGREATCGTSAIAVSVTVSVAIL